MEFELVALSRVELNLRNPRTISEANFNRLVDSLLCFPKMLELRPVVVTDRYTALGGNMRCRALKAISEMTLDEIESRLRSIRKYMKLSEPEKFDLLNHWEEFLQAPVVPCVMAGSLTKAELDEFVIKDNVGFGDWNWDELANDWDEKDLHDWGLDIPDFKQEPTNEGSGDDDGPKHECPNCGHLW